MIDFHTHVLPGIDDGSKTKEQSLVMLQHLRKQGCSQLVATPHFYPDQEIEVFLEQRQAAYDGLLAFAAEKEALDLPEIILGAEVLVGAELAKCEHLDQLCIGGTRYMLLEMPYGIWPKWVFQVVDELILRGITPIIAHLERYEAIVGLRVMQELLEREVIGQMNAYAVRGRETKGLARKLLAKGHIQLLGSDVHRVRQLERHGQSYDWLAQKHPEQLSKIQRDGEAVLGGAYITRASLQPIRKIWRFYF
ncbi:MAG: CpsB/CapC family capsule biosynthesis tyrosine phosphatase [Cellulosilyticaceae bacterium]